MSHYYYREMDGESQGPVEEAEIKELFRSGEVTKDAMVIKEGGKKWRRYEESFWVPPPIDNKGDSSLDWRDALAQGVCPLCDNSLLIRQKSLGLTKGVLCPHCQKRFAAKKLKEAAPATAHVYERSIWELLFSFTGRAGIKEFWLYGVLIPFVLSAIILAIPGIYSKDAVIWSSIVWIVSGLPTNVKRCHDHNLSGWVISGWVIACLLIPGLGFLLFLAYLWFAGFRKGKDDVNRFGPSAEMIHWVLR